MYQGPTDGRGRVLAGPRSTPACGRRLGEAVALEWSCVEWGTDANDPHRALVIRASRSRGGPVGLPKTGRERRVALSRRLRLHLRELWMRAGQPAAGLVVPGFEAANYRHRHFRRVCRAARIGEQWRPKDLRDSYASTPAIQARLLPAWRATPPNWFAPLR